MDKELLNNLSNAVSNGRTDIVRSLLSMCENGSAVSNGTSISANQVINEICNPSGTLLHLATKLDHVDIVRTLLSSGANPNIENAQGETPFDLTQSEAMTAVYVDELLKCSAKSELDRIKLLILGGVDVNSQDSPESMNTALHWAVCFGKPEAVQCLIDYKALPNVVNGQGVTPLHEAVQRKNIEIIKLLLAAGADPLFKATKGKFMDKSPLDIAEGNEEISQLLSEYLPKDSESEKSGEDSQSEQLSKDNVDNLSASLQSLNSISESSAKHQSKYTPLSTVHVPPFLLTPLPLITDSKAFIYCGQKPREKCQIGSSFFKLQPKYTVEIIHNVSDVSALSIIDVWNLHSSKFTSLGFECEVGKIIESNLHCCGDILCQINPEMFPRTESYKLTIFQNQLRIVASDLRGLHYALNTLEQLFTLYAEDGSLPTLFMNDWPQIHHRGVLLDIAYGARTPTLETLKGYIKTMSLLKLNQLHLYLKYEQNRGNTLPYTDKEFIELSRFCSDHFHHIPALMLVVHRLLIFGVSKKYNFCFLSSSFLKSQVLNSLWAGSVGVGKLLPENCILIDYCYQIEHNYDLNTKLITYAGFNVCIGTGTAVWGSISGSPETAVSCIHKAAVCATVHSAYGMIVADWQTRPHHPAFCFSWPGILLAVGLAWNASVHLDYLHARLPELLNVHIYQDATQVTGYLTVELGRLEVFMHQSIYQKYKDPKAFQNCKSSILHQLLVDADAVLLDHFTFDLLQQVIRHLRKFELEIPKARPTCFHHGEVISELRLAMDLLLFACRLSKVMVATGLNPSSNPCELAVVNVGISNMAPIARTDLANKLLALIEQFRAVWLSRNLPTGLETSMAMFNSLLAKLIPENDDSLYSVDRNTPLLQDLYSSTDNSARKLT
ncbi:Palmitoyltransferase AKR1 like protein [Argiope bruennichi]|uniref:Palmitoyltransferase AKR1 like protein n=1 Tax=Argiope bruennichi TaxID=94029 RepID=A0A8T0ES01_ARGBR|nr:Palmitoyltransferase AKR1 like protein [Argiope bruennichi]